MGIHCGRLYHSVFSRMLRSKGRIPQEIMPTIIFTKLSEENLHTDSLDEFVRYQEVKECWRKIGDEFILVPNEFVED